VSRFGTYKIALPPKTETKEGRGLQINKHLPPSTFTGQFLRKADIYSRVWWLYGYLVQGPYAQMVEKRISQNQSICLTAYRGSIESCHFDAVGLNNVHYLQKSARHLKNKPRLEVYFKTVKNHIKKLLSIFKCLL
jgi:hypothetical protein